jgi:hypothetical protein
MSRRPSPSLVALRRGSPERAGRPEGRTPQGCEQGALTGPAPGEAPTSHGAMSDRTAFDLNQLLGTPPSDDERRQALWAMTPAQRVAAMYAGELRLSDCLAWAARHPEQVPTLNGEWWFIAITTPEVADAHDHTEAD